MNNQNVLDITNVINNKNTIYTDIINFLNIDINKTNEICDDYIVYEDNNIYSFDENYDYDIMVYISNIQLFNKIVKIPIDMILKYNTNKSAIIEIIFKYNYVLSLYDKYSKLNDKYINKMLMIGDDEHVEQY